jgi:hypothetical protein
MVGAARVSTSNVESSAFTTQGKGLPHLPQCGAPRSLGVMLFFVPQLAQVSTEIGPAAVVISTCPAELRVDRGTATA